MLETTLQLGDAVEHRGVVIAPLFPRRTPVAEYATLEDALPLGLRIDEVSESGSVPQLAVANPTDANVLLYDGEELLGAKQNRILNVTVLVAAQSTTPIPVSCVEEGRWSRRSASFAAAPHAAHPELRRRKAQVLAAEPLALGHRPERGLGRGAGEVRAARRPLADRRAGGRLPLARGRAARARAGVPAPARPVRRAARARRRPLPRLRLAAGGLRAPLPEAARGLPARRARAAGRRSRRRTSGWRASSTSIEAATRARQPLGRARRGRARCTATASSARASSSTASCSSSAPSPAAERAAGGWRGRAGGGEAGIMGR